MSGTITVKELIVELLDQDMDDKVYIAHEKYPHSCGRIKCVVPVMEDDMPHGVYLIRRHSDEL